MTVEEIAHPKIVSQAEWLEQRKALLAKEKELTRQMDRINAERRRLPMVKVEKDYILEGPEGPRRLIDLFDGKHQLIVHHFMFGPDWEKGCPGCSGHVDSMGDLSDLGKRDTAMIHVSRAPIAKLEAWKAEKGWDIPWYSSLGSDFNYDFDVTQDPSVKPPVYNYKEMKDGKAGEAPGFSVFFRLGDDIFHTYSAYARGVEHLTDSYNFLDITPYGRQEDFEDSPEGWPQKPTYG